MSAAVLAGREGEKTAGFIALKDNNKISLAEMLD
jgi:hypothetical protein